MFTVFFRYASVGVINTLLHWGVFLLLHLVLGVSQAWSNFLAFTVAVSFSFVANASYTFQARATPLRYLMFTVLMGLLSAAVGAVSDWVSLSPWITLVVFSALSLIVGFVFTKWFVFRGGSMMLSLIVPVFNEEEAVPLFYEAVRNSAELSKYKVEIIFINDGSQDATGQVIQALIERDSLVTLVELSRNFGKEAALFAGLSYAEGDAVVPIDVDLQDPIEVIPELILRWQAGADVVLAKRVDRSQDSFMKRRSAAWFYRLHNRISSPKIEENVGDFRLMSSRVVSAILKMPERNLFMKGVLSWVGFQSEVIEYQRASRVAGASKFNGWKLWNLALEGITSFSTLPLRVWTYLGVSVALWAFLYAGWMVVDKIFWGNPVPGYPSLMTAILFLGGVQLIGIGVLGEYIGRIYIESKHRPRYVVKAVVGKSQHEVGG